MSKVASKYCPPVRVLWRCQQSGFSGPDGRLLREHIDQCGRCQGVLEETRNVVPLRPQAPEPALDTPIEPVEKKPFLSVSVLVLGLVMFVFGMITFAVGEQVVKTLTLRSDLISHLRYTYAERVVPATALTYEGHSLRLSFPTPWFEYGGRWPENNEFSPHDLNANSVHKRLELALSDRLLDQVDASLLQGYAYLMISNRDQHSLEQAKAALTLASQQSVGDADILNDLAVLTISMGQVQAGLAWLDQALTVDREHIFSLHNRAVMAGISGNIELERAFLQRYLRLEHGSKWSDPLRHRYEAMESKH